MIKFENTEVLGWEHAIRGMRNTLESWEKSDSYWCFGPECPDDAMINLCKDECPYYKKEDCESSNWVPYVVGPNDLDLMKRLRNAGTDHRKFMRMIVVYVDITAPLYWWKEFDTYKVGTVANSCSTMHKIADKEFTIEDFSHEHLAHQTMEVLRIIIDDLNDSRSLYLKTKNKGDWWQMIQLLPSSYNQKRTVMMNYEVLANIYKSRRNHKLDEWSENKLVGDYPSNMYPSKFTLGFCDWIKTLPYSELITGEFKEE